MMFGHSNMLNVFTNAYEDSWYMEILLFKRAKAYTISNYFFCCELFLKELYVEERASQVF